MNEVVWVSDNKHIIIALTKPIFPYHDKTYSVYREHRDHRKFNCIEFYNLIWNFLRWEDTFEEALKYAKSLEDSFTEDY